jgi:predicted nucleic acid-binding protein
MDEYRPTIYIETSIVSYLTSRPSRDILILARQERTRQWWEKERAKYHLVVSAFVTAEAREGHPEAAARRLGLLAGIRALDVTPEMGPLAADIQKALGIPEDSTTDALHLACASYHEVDYLLTWNCAHLAGGRSRRLVAELARRNGMWVPIICTPDEMIEENPEVE